MKKTILTKAQNSESLKNRLEINKKYSSQYLNSRIFGLFNFRGNKNIFELCAGTDNQIEIFSHKCPREKILALDYSKKYLRIIKEKKII